MARGADLPVIAIVGRPNVGKSTLFNRFVGRRRALVRDVPGVTRDRLYGQVSFERWQARVIDTGGFDPSSVEPLIEGVRRQILTALEEADLVLFVVDARDGVTALDAEIARALRRTGRPVVLAANKVDGPGQEPGLADLYRLGVGEPVPVSAEHGRGVVEQVRDRLPFLEHAPVCFTSAVSGDGAPEIFDTIDEVATEFGRQIGPAEVTATLRAAIERRPVSVGGAPLVLQSASQVSTAPPTLALRVSKPDDIHSSYARYLVKSLRHAFGFAGTPIRLSLRKGAVRRARAGARRV